MVDSDWWQRTSWNAENDAEFEKRISRARFQRQFYMYSQGWALTKSASPSDRAVGRNLLRRAADEPVGFDGFRALDALAESLATEGLVDDALAVRDHARMLRAASPTSHRGDIATEAFEHAEALFEHRPDAAREQILQLLEEAMPELEVEMDRSRKFRLRRLYAQVLGLRGDAAAGRMARTLLSDLRGAPELFEQWLGRSELELEADLIVISDAFPADDDEPPPSIRVETDFVGLMQLDVLSRERSAEIATAPDDAPARERTVESTIAEVLTHFEAQAHLNAKLDLAAIYRATEFLRRREHTIEPAELQKLLHSQAERARSAREYWVEADETWRQLGELGLEVGTETSLYPQGPQWDARALPVVLDRIARSRNSAVRRDLLRVLYLNAWSRPGAAGPLLEMFRELDSEEHPPSGELRWLMVRTICRTATDRLYPEILEMASDERVGEYRAQFIGALGRMRKHRDALVPIMMGFLLEESHSAYLPAATVLARWNIDEARLPIRRLLYSAENSPDPVDHGERDRLNREKHELKLALKKFKP